MNLIIVVKDVKNSGSFYPLKTYLDYSIVFLQYSKNEYKSPSVAKIELMAVYSLSLYLSYSASTPPKALANSSYISVFSS
jgi:hypothetical protein